MHDRRLESYLDSIRICSKRLQQRVAAGAHWGELDLPFTHTHSQSHTLSHHTHKYSHTTHSQSHNTDSHTPQCCELAFLLSAVHKGLVIALTPSAVQKPGSSGVKWVSACHSLARFSLRSPDQSGAGRGWRAGILLSKICQCLGRGSLLRAQVPVASQDAGL